MLSTMRPYSMCFLPLFLIGCGKDGEDLLPPAPSVGSARITVTTTGLSLDPDGYRVIVDGSDRGAIASNGTFLTGLEPGSHTIGLTGLASNCGLDGPGSRTVTILAAEVVPVEFAVACTAEVTPHSGIAFVSTRDGDSPTGCGAGCIYVANSDGSGVRRLTQGRMPAWSPDGRRIAFHRSSQIRVINVDGSGERVLTTGWNPAWSPDGWRIMYDTGETPSRFSRLERGIFIMDAAGTGNPKLVISNEFAEPHFCVCWPTWSPGGQRIAFLARGNWDYISRLYTMELAGSPPQRLFPSGWSVKSRPNWSPDGSRLLLELGLEQIGSIRIDGSDFRTHTSGEMPDWSPDGKSVVFTKFAGPGSRRRIFVLEIETGAVRQLIPDVVAPVLADYWDSEPVWSRVKP